jgi:NADPH2:quinone reductase
MRAVWYSRQGPAREVLEFGEIATPEPGPGEALVRLHASGVNPADAKRRAGATFGMEHPRVIPNSDGAGVVEAVGEGADPALTGRRVWLYNGQRGGRWMGTAAEFIALDARLLRPLPDWMSFEQGAGLGIPGLTAWCCVHADGPVQGTDVLVTGGAGAVGFYAVQLAARAGARVIATVRGEADAEAAAQAGAATVIRREREDVAARVLEATAGKGVERIVEVAFGENLPVTLEVLAMNGVVAAYAAEGEREPRVPYYALMRKCAVIRAVMLPGMPEAMRRRAQDDMSDWIAQGGGMHRVAGSFPLAETAAAHEAVEAGGKRGTVVVRPDL